DQAPGQLGFHLWAKLLFQESVQLLFAHAIIINAENRAAAILHIQDKVTDERNQQHQHDESSCKTHTSILSVPHCPVRETGLQDTLRFCLPAELWGARIRDG